MALVLTLTMCMVRFGLARLRSPMALEQRAHWVQSSCRRILACLGIEYEVQGEPPAAGLVVANHLSYLDILILSAAMPCFFVAKAEIASWPFFGIATRCGGTIYINRASRRSAEKVAGLIASRLQLPVPVLFFPEGTSSDGTALLPFHSRLFEPAIRCHSTITSASVRYRLHHGMPERELCWFGDDAFLPHLWKALGYPGFTAEVRFGAAQVYPDRRTAAEQTYAEIAAMRSEAELILQ